MFGLLLFLKKKKGDEGENVFDENEEKLNFEIWWNEEID
jgi:hypothetical protein